MNAPAMRAGVGALARAGLRAAVVFAFAAATPAAFAQPAETKEGVDPSGTAPPGATAPVAPPAATPGGTAPTAPVAAPPAAQAPAPDPRRIERVSLPDGRTVVVAESEFEPRSIGSYVLRVYEAAGPAVLFDRFAMGIVRPRDGAIERVLLQDLDRDGRPELVVVMRTAGSGGYLSADAWSFGDRRIARRASVNGLPANADPIAALVPRVRRATAP